MNDLLLRVALLSISLLDEKLQEIRKNAYEAKLSADINMHFDHPDDISTVFADKYGGIILGWTGIIFILVGLLLLCSDIYTSGLQTVDSVLSVLCWAFFVLRGIYIICMYLWARKRLQYAEKRSKVHSRNQNLVVRPYKNKFTLKNIKEILEILNYFKR